MTREEAIADIRDNIKPVVGGISLDMAIEALEQQSCEEGERMKDYNLINQRATTCRHGGHCEWVACDKCNHYEPDGLNQQPCEDCISRQAVDELSKELVHTTRDKADFLCKFWEELQKLPSVTPKENTGKWFDDANKIDAQFGRHTYICSECGKYAEYFISGTEVWWDRIKPNFCPNCGSYNRSD